MDGSENQGQAVDTNSSQGGSDGTGAGEQSGDVTGGSASGDGASANTASEGSSEPVIDWQARAVDAEAKLGDMSVQLASVSDELAQAIAQRDALQAAADAALLEPRALPSTATKMRKVEALGNPALADLLASIKDAQSVELVFSDGTAEIAGISGQIIEGDAWRISPVGLALSVPNLIVTGPGPQIVELGGYALFIDGKQAAWAPRPDVLRIAPGARMNLSGDVVFSAA
jgi:hypothetical protein